MLAVVGALACDLGARAAVLGSAEIQVLGIEVDMDTRPDVAGVQNTMTAVKNIPAGLLAFVGSTNSTVAPGLPAGAMVRAEITGPSFGDDPVTISGMPNQLLELPRLVSSGDHVVYNVRLEDADGNILLRRNEARDTIVINVIDEILVTQVTSRPLTLDEIRERGIVIDSENFTVMNFTIGLTLGSEAVTIDLPVVIPQSYDGLAHIEAPAYPRWDVEVMNQFDRINIPNFTLSGFSLMAPPEIEEQGITLPPIAGVIIIPGNIAFLNQYFSVIVDARNAAPMGSGLVISNAQARIVLPAGEDEISGSGDDPLRLAELAGGTTNILPLLDDDGSPVLPPQGAANAEFLVEGLREGTHEVSFDITGTLYIPSLGSNVTLTGRAVGLVQVENPMFDVVLAHPDVVREGEEYSLFATVVNISDAPANLFSIEINQRSLSGCRLADGETGSRSVDSLAAGASQTFEFRLVARETGEVSGTVLLADEGINGSFVLTTGVGDTGIPLSPDTLILPQTTEYLPDDPDVVFGAVRLLGMAYSLATAPSGSLPDGTARVTRGFVFERAVKLAQAGLRIRFGEGEVEAIQDLVVDYLGNDLHRLETVAGDDISEQATLERNLEAWDTLRRTCDAGQDLDVILAGALAPGLDSASLEELQRAWAERFASQPPHLSMAVSGQGAPVVARLTDGDGAALGRAGSSDEPSRDLAYGAAFTLETPGAGSEELLFVAAPESDQYTFEFFAPDGAATVDLGLVIPNGETGMIHVVYTGLAVAQGGFGRATWFEGAGQTYPLYMDSDGNGSLDRLVAPSSVTALADRPPSLLGVHQWAKGDRPETEIGFENGDPIGRLVGVLFDEEVLDTTAERETGYTVGDNLAQAALLQPDDRLVFVLLDKPVGPFVERSLQVEEIADRRANILESAESVIQGDPDRGDAGVVSGRVLGPDGTPIPYAEIQYIQPLQLMAALADCDAQDYVVCTYTADAEGRYSIDFVLRNSVEATCNADVWLNEQNTGGTSHFKLEAADPVGGGIGRASTKVLYDGQHMNLNVIIRGYGAIQGTVYEADGTPAVGGNPDGADPLYVYANNLSSGGSLVTWVDANGHYALPREFIASNGTEHTVGSPSVGNVSLSILRASDLAVGLVTVNIPGAGERVEQDIVLLPQAQYFGTVRGRVLEAGGTEGAAGVVVQIAADVLTSVSVQSATYAQSVVGRAVTDAAGFFGFENVPAGDVEVRAFRQETYEQAEALSRLEPGGALDLVLVLPGSGGTVRGLVRDALGNAVPHATVAGGPTQTEADENGWFEIPNLPIGRFTIYGQDTNSLATGSEEVQIVSADDIIDIVITLEAVGTIEGTVYQADAITPAAGQAVQLWVEAAVDGVIGEAVTDEAGHYEFVNYPVYDYSVRAVTADYGDGGMALTAIRFAGDHRVADVTFRGLGEIKGRVVQTNDTPVIADIIITRKVWRIIPGQSSDENNYYLDYANSLIEAGGEFSDALANALESTSVNDPGAEFFMLLDESVALSSDILDTNGAVTGRFHFEGPAAGGDFTVAAFGPYLTPAEVSREIPRTTNPSERIVDVGDIILQPSVGELLGTVYLPDGVTPVGENVAVKVRSLDNSGSVMAVGGAVEQPVLPEIDVVTDENGQFHFPLVLRGRFVLTADTGVPDPAIAAHSPAEQESERFYDDATNRVLNVRLYGQVSGVLPAGEIMETDVRLRDVAGIAVTIVENDGTTPVPFAEVTVTTESSLDAAEEADFADQVANAAGEIAFFPLIEGAFSVSARDPASPAQGRAAGTIPVNPTNGYEAAVKVTLGASTSGSGEVIPADVFGTVTGLVFKADGTPLDNPAEIAATVDGVRILATSDNNGAYAVENVPGGYVSLTAYEPFTARRGSAHGSLATNGQVINVPITLVGLGTVAGSIFQNESTTTVVGANVTLYPSGNFSDALVSKSDLAGRYSLPGVPVGAYTVEAADPTSDLAGEASGTMAADGDENTTDVYLEPSAMISGVVYAAGVYLDAGGQPVDENGDPLADPAVSANASVTLRSSSITRTIQADTNGLFGSGAWLTLGRYNLAAAPLTGNDGATGAVTLAYNGQVGWVPLALAGQGSVTGVVLDSLGVNPVNAARVTLYSGSRYTAGPVTRFTDAAGRFAFSEVPVGSFSLAVETTLQAPELGGAASGALARHGDAVAFLDGDADTNHNAIRLQEAGDIRGVVTLADGTTAVSGAVVTVEGGSVSLVVLSDAAGAFSVPGLPLATYQVSVIDPDSGGVAAREAVLDTNGQVLDLGVLALDGDPPSVIFTAPAAGAVNMHPTCVVQVVFSEPLDPDTVSTQTFQVLVSGAQVAGTFDVAPGDPAVVFRPAAPFPDLTPVVVRLYGDTLGFEGQVLEEGLRDPAGLGLDADYEFGFTTSDSTPPSLASVSPADGSDEADLSSVIRVVFSEPVDRASLLEFTLLRGGTGVEGTTNQTPILGDTVFVFTPEDYLLPNTLYTIRITGPVRDLAGNAMAETNLAFTFATVDTLPPVIDSLAFDPGAVLVEGRTVTVIANLSTGSVDTASVEFYVNDALAGEDGADPYAYALYLDPAFGTQVVVSAIAEDEHGNRSARRDLNVAIAGNQPPSVSVTEPAAGSVWLGSTVTVGVAATDDVALAQVSWTANDGQAGGGSRAVTGTAANATFAFPVPTAWSLGSNIVLQAAAVDSLGLVATSAPVVLSPLDGVAPSAAIVAPAAGTEWLPGGIYTAEVRGLDNVAVSAAWLRVSGAFETEGSAPAAVPAATAVVAIAISVPGDVPADGGAVHLFAGAWDTSGNTSAVAVLDIAMQDLLPPTVTGTVPTNDQENVALRPELAAQFSEAVDSNTVAAGMILRLDTGGDPIPVTTLLDPGGEGLAATPEAPLDDDTWYALALTNIADLAGNVMTGAVVRRFRTADVRWLSPLDGAYVLEGHGMTAGVAGVEAAGAVSLRWFGPTGSLGVVTSAPWSVSAGIPLLSELGATVVVFTVEALDAADTVLCVETGIATVCALGADTDGDGIDNGTELEIGSDPFTWDSGEDFDFDGLTNLQEVTLGSDPLDPDTDGDGMLDGADGDPLVPNAPPIAGAEQRGAGLSFDGLGAYAEIPSKDVIQPSEGTLEFWYVPADTTGIRHIVYAGEMTGTGFGSASEFHVSLDNGDLRFFCHDGSAAVWDIRAPGVAAGETGHVAVVWSAAGGYARMYVQGREAAEGAAAAADNSAWKNSVRWGRHFSTGFPERAYAGRLGEVRFWSHARTQAEIRLDMQRVLDGGEAGLSGWWRMNERNGPLTYDGTPGVQDARLGNGAGIFEPAWTDVSPPMCGEPVYLVSAGGQETLFLDGRDRDGDALVAIVTGLPGGGRLYQTADGLTPGAEIAAVPQTVTDPLRRVIYEPDPAFQGVDEFQYAVSDGQETSAAVRAGARVFPVNHLPVAHDDVIAGYEGQDIGLDALLLNDTDGDGDALIVVNAGTPAHGRVEVRDGGEWWYVPDEGFTGTDSFLYVVADSERWNRRETWMDGMQAGGFEGNPGADSLGMEAWRLEYVQGKDLASAKPWYRQGGARLVWDDNGFTGEGVWSRSDDSWPAVTREALVHSLMSVEAAQRAPVVRWLAPADGMMVDLLGSLRVRWTGKEDMGSPVDVDVVVAVLDASTGTVSPLQSWTVSKPSPGDSRGDEVALDLAVTNAAVDLGDEILVSARGRASLGLERWIELKDALYILPSAATRTATAIVEIAANAAPVAGTAVAGSALFFEDASSLVSLPASVLDGLSNLTVEFWMTIESGNMQAVMSGANAGDPDEFLLTVDETHVTIQCDGQMSGWDTDSLVGAPVHVTFVRRADPPHAELYLFQESAGDRPMGALPLAVDTSGLLLGQDQGSVGGDFEPLRAFAGTLDEVRVWNTARTSNDIAAWLYRPLTGTEAGLQAYWRMDEGAGLTASDAGAGGYDASLGAGDPGRSPVWTGSPALLFAESTSTLENTDVTLTMVGSDADGDPLAAIIAEGPASGALYQTPDGITRGEIITNTDTAVTDPGLRVIYVPGAGFHGVDFVRYRMSDGKVESDEAVMTIVVEDVNQPPVASNDYASTMQNRMVTTDDVRLNDTDADGDELTVSSYTLPTNGTLTDRGDGLFEYQPDPGFVGTDSFTYRVSDGEYESDPATVEVQVVEVVEYRWISPTGGNWNVAANWDRGSVPGTNASVMIDLAGTYTVRLNAHATIATMRLGADSGGQSLRINGRTLQLAFSGEVASNGIIELIDGSIEGAGGLSVAGGLVWSGGHMDGGDRFITGWLSITGSAVKALNGCELRNEGLVTWSGGTLQLVDGASVLNDNGGDFDVRGNLLLDWASGSMPRFENRGRLRKSAGTGTATFEAEVENRGEFKVQAGTLHVTGPFRQTAGSVILDGGDLQTDQPAEFQAGSLEGAGTLDGSVSMRGTLQPGSPPGRIEITGDWQHESPALAAFDVEGTARGSTYDALDIGGGVQLQGALSVTFGGGYTGAAGEAFNLIRWTNYSGAFSSTNVSGLGAGLAYEISYAQTGLVLSVVAAGGGGGSPDACVLTTIAAPASGEAGKAIPLGAADEKTPQVVALSWAADPGLSFVMEFSENLLNWVEADGSVEETQSGLYKGVVQFDKSALPRFFRLRKIGDK